MIDSGKISIEALDFFMAVSEATGTPPPPNPSNSPWHLGLMDWAKLLARLIRWSERISRIWEWVQGTGLFRKMAPTTADPADTVLR